MAKIENYAMLLKTFIYHPKLSGILTQGRVVFPSW